MDFLNQMAEKPTESLTTEQAKAYRYRQLGHTIEETAQIMGVGLSTVKRRYQEAKEFYEELGVDGVEKDQLDRLEPKAWDALEDALAPDAPDTKTRAHVAIKVLNAKGKMVDRKQIDLGGEVKLTLEQVKQMRQDNLKQGVESFGVHPGDTD